MLVAIGTGAMAQAPKPQKAQDPATSAHQTMPPTHADIRYGNHERNLLDLWIATSNKPTPLAIFVHGGGFVDGDKDRIPEFALKELLAAGISVASVNYRYCVGQPDGALSSIRDVCRSLQYLRSRAGEWNIDKNRVGMWGQSAGAGATAWIAFHDEMAEPTSLDPVLRESSRLKAVYLVGVQANYDTFGWPELFGLDETNPLILQLHKVWTKRWLGLGSINEKDSSHGLEMRRQLDIVSLMSDDDPPFVVNNNQRGELPPTVFGSMMHHPLFAKMFYDRGKELALDCLASTEKAPDYGLNDKTNVQQFFKRKL